MDSIQLTAWMWLAAAIILIASELIIPSFTVIWFGLGALVVSALMWFMPELSLTWQILSWTLSSIAFTALWYFYFKPKQNSFSPDQVDAAEGEIGLVVKPPNSLKDKGTAKFPSPILGTDQWEFTCNESLVAGDKIVITAVKNNTLIVNKK